MLCYVRCETVIGVVLCCCHQARCLLYYFGKINSGIHMYFTPLFSDVVVVSDLNKNFGRSTDLAKKRHGSADLHTPIHPPRYTIHGPKSLIDFVQYHTKRYWNPTVLEPSIEGCFHYAKPTGQRSVGIPEETGGAYHLSE